MLSFSNISNTLHTAAVASGLPPYVVPWSPGHIASATSFVAANAPTGTPHPSALADVMISGFTP